MTQRRSLIALLNLSLFFFPLCLLFLSSVFEDLHAQDNQQRPASSGWVGGRYFLSRRIDVPGATVKLHSGKDELFITTTDENGRWSFRNVPAGACSIEIFKEGYLPIKKSDVAVKVPFKTIIELQAIPSKKAFGSVLNWSPGESAVAPSHNEAGSESAVSRITGRIISRDGNPLTDAEIVMKSMGGAVDPCRAISDAEGAFSLDNVLPGVYDVTISSIAYFTARLSLNVKADLTMSVVMTSQPQNYQYTPSELIPAEEPVPPSGQSS